MKKAVLIVFLVMLIPIAYSFFYFIDSDIYTTTNLKLYFKFDNTSLSENMSFSAFTSKKNISNTSDFTAPVSGVWYLAQTVNTSASDFMESITTETFSSPTSFCQFYISFYYNDSEIHTTENIFGGSNTYKVITTNNPYLAKGVDYVEIYLIKSGVTAQLTDTNTTVFNGTVISKRLNTSYYPINASFGYDFIIYKNASDLHGSNNGDDDVTYNDEGAGFDGSTNEINLTSIELDYNNATLCIWFNSIDSDASVHYIINSSSGGGAYGYLRMETDGSLALEANTNAQFWYDSITPLDYSDELLFCVVANQTSIKTYIDNELNKTQTSSYNFSFDSIGVTYEGNMSKITVFNYTLSIDELTELYNEGSFSKNILDEEDAAINFTGNDFIILEPDQFTESDFTSGITLGGFFKVATPTALNTMIMVDLEGKVGLSVFKNTNLYQVYLRGGGAGNQIRYQVDDVLSWHHLAMTYDRTILKMYVDGNLVNSTAYSLDTGIDDVSKLSGFGGLVSSPSQFYFGLMDEATLYNYALSSSEIGTIYSNDLGQSRLINLIDERDRIPFDVSNLSTVKVYNDETNMSYDFKKTNTNNVSIAYNESVKLRFEFITAGGDVIDRYVDTNLSTGNLRICVNKDDTIHYEQLVISHSTENAARVESVYANCIVGEDYTRFVYQTFYMFKAYTIQTQYYLYKYSDGVPVFLASMDGSIQTYYDLDALEFAQTAYDISIIGDTIGFNKSNTTVTIYYNNLENDSVSTNIVLERLNLSVILLNTTETTSPNEFYVVFDYSTLANVSDMELFKIEITTTDGAGLQDTNRRYFNIMAQEGIMPSGVAFAISILLVVFGLTLVAVQYSLGWFGALIMIIAIGILGFGVMNWYILLLMGVELIILIFIIMNLVYRNIITVV